MPRPAPLASWLLIAASCRSGEIAPAASDPTRPNVRVGALAAAAALSPLEIHQINVQQGDCTLIVGPDGTTFLIDAGKNGHGTSDVVPYLASLGIDDLDFMLCTHRDEDHLGGLDEVIVAGFDVRQAVWDNGSSKADSPSQTSIGDFLTRAQATTAGAVQRMPLGHVVQLGGGATATCVAVHGEVLGHGPVTGITEEKENDLSVAILVRHGSFEYLTAGDLGGGDSDRSCTHRETGQVDVETPLALSLRSEFGANLLEEDGLEVLDVNHHGSESSTNSSTMNLLTPALALINTGGGQGGNFRHPRVDVVEGVLSAQAPCIEAAPALVLQTDEGDPVGDDTSRAGFFVGDIVVRTDGVAAFTVTASGRTRTGQSERAAAGIGASGRTFPLDGASLVASGTLVITEIMRDPAAVSDTAGEWFEVHNPTLAAIDLDGWTIKDDDTDRHTITSNVPLLVPAGGFFVLGRNADPAQNGGYTAGYVYTGVNLANGGDEVVLVNPSGTVIDRVAYTSSWPASAGAAIALTSFAADNDSPANWATATARGGSFTGAASDFGTPGIGPATP